MQNQDPTQDTKNYRFIFYYYNPDDERVFVPKKIASLGVTLNFAQPKAYLFLISFLSFAGFIAYLCTQK